MVFKISAEVSENSCNFKIDTDSENATDSLNLLFAHVKYCASELDVPVSQILEMIATVNGKELYGDS